MYWQLYIFCEITHLARMFAWRLAIFLRACFSSWSRSLKTAIKLHHRLIQMRYGNRMIGDMWTLPVETSYYFCWKSSVAYMCGIWHTIKDKVRVVYLFCGWLFSAIKNSSRVNTRDNLENQYSSSVYKYPACFFFTCIHTLILHDVMSLIFHF